jgi:hypothetical protein
MPSPGTGHHIEVVLPGDLARLFLRVSLDNDWAGYLLFASADDRSAFLDALTAGEISVARRQIPLTDVYGDLDVAPAAGTAGARNR